MLWAWHDYMYQISGKSTDKQACGGQRRDEGGCAPKEAPVPLLLALEARRWLASAPRSLESHHEGCVVSTEKVARHFVSNKWDVKDYGENIIYRPVLYALQQNVDVEKLHGANNLDSPSLRTRCRWDDDSLGWTRVKLWRDNTMIENEATGFEM